MSLKTPCRSCNLQSVGSPFKKPTCRNSRVFPALGSPSRRIAGVPLLLLLTRITLRMRPRRITPVVRHSVKCSSKERKRTNGKTNNNFLWLCWYPCRDEYLLHLLCNLIQPLFHCREKVVRISTGCCKRNASSWQRVCLTDDERGGNVKSTQR